MPRTLGVNPWSDLPDSAPYILPKDKPFLDRYARPGELQFDLLPVPYMGDPARAEVVLLSLNPRAGDDALMARPDYVSQRRAALIFGSKVPFVPLDPRFASRDGYWQVRLGSVIRKVGVERVAAGVACVEFFPYQSRTFRQLQVPVPSQLYGFDLVRDAVASGKEIVILRGEQLWTLAVPELVGEYVMANSVRAGSISPRNIGEDSFERIVTRLGA